MSVRALGLVVGGAVLSACVLWWARAEDLTGSIPAFLLSFFAAFVAYLVALHSCQGMSRGAFSAAIVAAVVWRAVLVCSPPLLSDDVYRYVWEGRIQIQGGNPYKWADRPDSPKWERLRDSVWQRMNHKHYTAIYPPLFQMAARGVVGLRDSTSGMKGFLTLCELSCLGLLSRVLKCRGLPRERLLVAAWSPLAMVEIAGSGHNEAFGLLFLAGALLALDCGRPFLSALLAALAFQAKVVPGLVAASWWRRYTIRGVLAGGLLAACLFAPYAGARQGLFRSLGSYGEYWRFNATLFALMEWLLRSREAALLASGLLLLSLTLLLGAGRVETGLSGLLVLAGWILLMPSVFPWYALWLIPFLVVEDAPFALLFTGTVVLAYCAYLGGGTWEVSSGVRALEYGPCAAVLALALRRRRT